MGGNGLHGWVGVCLCVMKRVMKDENCMCEVRVCM